MYPTPTNKNGFALLETVENDEDNDKMIVTRNHTQIQMEASYNTDALKKKGILDAGVTGHFVLPGTPVENLKSEIKPISIRLPDGSKIMSTHICELNIDGIPAQARISHIVPDLTHDSLIFIRVLFYAG